MFYEGDLQSGISKALQESKLVACFVTDEGDESQLWENDFLEDPSLKSSLSNETILLRLQAGTQEAGYLAAIFPLPKTPTLVVIQNGELKEYITAGVPKDEFLRRLGGLLESRAASTTVPIPSTPAPSAQEAQNSEPTVQSNSSAVRIEEPQVRAQPSTAGTTGSGSKSKEQKKPEQGKGKGKQKAEPQDDAPVTPHQVPEWEMKYALKQKKLQEDKKNERARILKRVEDDKIERRSAAAQKSEENKIKNSFGSTQAGSTASKSKTSRQQHKECALQIRLFDGTSIRSKFPSSATLLADIRPWIDEQQPGNAPYTFKQILTPLPNRSISISDEEQSLLSQGLAPTATLILVPVQGYATAYNSDSASSVISKGVSTGVSTGYGLVSSGVGMITGFLGSFLGGGSTPAVAPPQDEPPAAASDNTGPSSSNINIRTLRDRQPEEDQQFYNGNALNFEPRHDDDRKED